MQVQATGCQGPGRRIRSSPSAIRSVQDPVYGMDTSFRRIGPVDSTRRVDPIGRVQWDGGPCRCGVLEGEPVGRDGGVKFWIEPYADGGGFDADHPGSRVDQCRVL